VSGKQLPLFLKNGKYLPLCAKEFFIPSDLRNIKPKACNF